MGDDSSAKYHQVAIPDHPGGSSFVRMGSFPSGGDPAPLPASYDKARALAGMSASRLTTSGHWSHTDGNRITTTVGNVVEIIQGSYISMRSAAASPPGPALNASWTQSSYTQTGSTDYAVGGGASAGDPTGTQPDPFEITYAQTGGATDTTGTDTKAAPGDAITVTWAGRVMTYVGSSSKPVPYVFTQTYGGKVATYNYTTVDNVTLNTATGGDVSATTTITGGGSANTTTTITGGGSANTSTTVTGGSASTSTSVSGGTAKTTVSVTGGTILTENEADAITTTNTAPLITNVNTAANTLNFTFGIIENVNVGLALGNLNLCAGIANINLGAQTTVNLPEKFQFDGLKTVVSVEETKATALDNRFKAVDNSIKGVETKIADTKTDLSALESTVGAQADRIMDNEIHIGICNTDLRDLIFGF